jgi:hypothetical protein
LIWSPSPVIHHVSVIYLIWFWTFVVSWLMLGIMAVLCGVSVKQLAGRDNKIRHAVWLGMANPWFWPLYWGSLLATVINNIAPLFLFLYVPLWTAIGVNAINLASSVGAPFVRVWIWRIHSQNEVPVG